MSPERITSQGLSVDQQTYIGPVVLRDDRGQIRWRLPGNTPEDNMQLGINNIQGLFLERFPEFDQTFPRDSQGRILEVLISQARQFIRDHVGTKKQFDSIFGGSATQKKAAPYFNGRYTTVIQISFERWGIKIIPPELNNSLLLRLRIGSDRYVDRNGIGWLLVQRLHQEYGITHRAIIARLGDIPVRKVTTGGKRESLMYEETLSRERLDSFLALPKVDKSIDVFVDDAGTSWVTRYHLQKRYKQLGHFPSDCLDSVSCQKGRVRNNRESLLYNETQATHNIEAFFSLPQIDKSARMYIDNNGDKWVPAFFFTKELKKEGLQIDLAAILNDIPKKEGRTRGRGGKKMVLFNRLLALERIEYFLCLPRINRDTNNFQDQSGDSWVVRGYLQTKYKMGYKSMERLLEGVSSLEGRGIVGYRTTLYNEREATERIMNFLSHRNANETISPEQANEQLRKLLEG